MSSETVRWTIIGHLDDSAKLLDRFFSDVKYFKESARKSLSVDTNEEEKKTEDNDDKINNRIIGNGKFKYLDEIQERLTFLEYILSNNSGTKLSAEYANIFWQSFVVNALTIQGREAAFISLKKMIHTGMSLNDINLQENVAEIVFTKHMIQDMKIENMTQSGYDCFERYFVFVNCQKKYLEMLGSNKFFVVNNYYDLVGLEMLWQITLNTKNDIVYKKSIDLMNQTCNRVSIELKDEIGKNSK